MKEIIAPQPNVRSSTQYSNNQIKTRIIKTSYSCLKKINKMQIVLVDPLGKARQSTSEKHRKARQNISDPLASRDVIWVFEWSSSFS